jgi:tetratricopeptide (TPR) repeat protein
MNRAERRSQDRRDLLEQALVHHRAGRFGQAEALYQQVLDRNPRHAEALHLLGLLTYQRGKLGEASGWLARAVAEDASQAAYFYNYGVVLQRLGRVGEAGQAYEQALRLNPQHVEAHSNLGNLLREQGRLDEAVAAYRRALALNPNYVDGYNNLGVALEELGRYAEAMSSYEQALRLNPAHAEAHSNLGNTLKELGRLDEAISRFQHALTLKPDYAKAHYNLAFAFLWQGRLDRAHESFMRSGELKQNHRRPITLSRIYKSRVRHDAEQVHYLHAHGLLPGECDRYVAALDRLKRDADRDPDRTKLMDLDRDRAADLTPSFNRILHHAAPGLLPSGTLNPNLDVHGIEARYHASRPEIMHVDELLNEAALTQLRRCCLESTVWKKDYDNGYLGAFLGDGLSSPLLLQISEDLRLRFPRIFGEHRLRQAWAFKYDSRLQGLNIHADAAAVNVNFWITPDEANLDPDHGGLIVWDKEAPKEWNFREYNSTAMEPKIREFLRQSGAHAVTIPYRQNRAVIFNSDLFHETDRISFRGGYENRRINVTLLYGKRFA